jgi:hypothetical protein
MGQTMRLLPPEVLPVAQRRAWSRRHPVRVSLGHTLLVTPFVAAFVLLAQDVAWSTRLTELVLGAAATFAVAWTSIRYRWADRLPRASSPSANG